MKIFKLLFAFLLIGIGTSSNVWADRGHHGHFGVVIGAPFFSPWYYPPYYYPPYYPPVVIERQAAPVYIEQQSASPAVPEASAPNNYWYYCVRAKAYYPYVKDCPGGWQKVSPQPPAQP